MQTTTPKIVHIAPYVASIEETHRNTSVVIRDENGKQVLRCNYDKFLQRYRDIKITVDKTAKIHDVITVMDELVKEF